MRRKLSVPGRRVLGQHRQRSAQLWPCGGHVGFPVPGAPEGTGLRGKAACHAGAIHIQKRLQLDQMRRFFLDLGLPDQRPGGELGARERVLAAHEIQVARPQQPVIGILVEHGQNMQGQRATLPGCAGLQVRAA